jgi:hypothetical protein
LIGIGGDAAALEEDMLDVSFDRWLAHERQNCSSSASSIERIRRSYRTSILPPSRGNRSSPARLQPEGFRRRMTAESLR